MNPTSISRPKPLVIGLAGGSGSGKTYFAKELLKRLGSDEGEIVYQDNFYFDQSSRFDYDGGSVNFDHPASIDFDLLAERLGQLKEGFSAEIPVYDFKTHSRQSETLTVHPKRFVLVDGILIFHAAQVRRLFDDLIFFDTPEELRFERRLKRDVFERGRTPEGVRNQFFRQVKPMHDAFVEPSKAFALTRVRDIEEVAAMLDSYAEKLLALKPE